MNESFLQDVYAQTRSMEKEGVAVVGCTINYDDVIDAVFIEPAVA